MQQATLNLFADMGAQPDQILPGLTRATATTDTTAPTSTITSPSAGGTVADGAQVTVSGTASDTGGGVVAGVEVSTDGGATWHPATGTTSWTYSWIAHGNPSTVVKTRAVDDSGNLQTPGAGVAVNVSCPCSLWGSNVTPPQPDLGDPSPTEVGVKFKADTFGTITGIRFYKGAGNTGTHVGSLWTASGQRSSPRRPSPARPPRAGSRSRSPARRRRPGTTYIASYYAPNGHYAGSAGYFYPPPSPPPNGGGSVDSAPLHALRNTGTTTNGVYTYSASSTFPVSTFGASNYWVDVVFAPTPPPGQVTGVTATAGGRTSATVSWTAPASGGPPSSYTITPYVGSTAQTPTTVNGSPPATTATVSGLTTGTTYTFRVRATNPNGTGADSAASGPVTPLSSVAPSPPTDVVARPATTSALVSWSAPGSDGDSPITGYTVTPYVGATAQTPVAAGASATSATVTGLTNGTSYTFTVTATNAIGTGLAGLQRGDPAGDDLRLRHARRSTRGRRKPGRAGREVHAPTGGIDHRHPLLQGGGQHRHARRQPVVASGTRLAQATFTGESASGWQTVTFADAGRDHGRHDVRRVVLRAQRPLLGHERGLRLRRRRQPAAACARRLHGRERGLRLQRVEHVPEQQLQRHQLLGRRPVRDPAPGCAERRRRQSGRTHVGGRVVVGARERRSPELLHDHALRRRDGAGAHDSDRLAAGHRGDSRRAHAGHDLHLHRAGGNASGSGPASAPSAGVTPLVAVAPTAPTDVLARPATTSARVSWTAPSGDGDSPITGYTVTPYAGSTAQSPVQVDAASAAKTITGLDNGTSYTFRVTATNAIGTSPAATSVAVIPQATIFDFATPAVTDAGDSSAVELGVKFRSDSSGSVTGIRFYKASANTGSHVGSLWTAGGTRLAQANFTGESASGWQTVTFASPVAIAADTTYIASYHAPNGHYSVTGSAFSPDGVENPPLRALADIESANGVYAYSATSAFPTSSFNAGNYWVDVLFAGPPSPGQASNVSAAAGPSSATVSWSAPTSGGPPTSYRVTPYIGSNAQPATTSPGSQTSTTISGLSPGTAYTFSVRALNSSGSGPESSPSSAVTPLAAGTPGAPTGVSAAADTKAARVSWTAPASDGGSAITGYTLTPYAGSTAQTPTQAAAAARSATVTGLTNGTTYTFRITATNAAGTSPSRQRPTPCRRWTRSSTSPPRRWSTQVTAGPCNWASNSSRTSAGR